MLHIKHTPHFITIHSTDCKRHLRCLAGLRSKFRTAFEFLPVTPLKTREVTEKDGVLRNTANRATFFTI